MGIKERSLGKHLTLRKDVIEHFLHRRTFVELEMESQCLYFT